MPMLADLAGAVIGVDTHTDTHTAAVVNRLGAHLATIEVSADAAGYARLITLGAGKSPGPKIARAVEGCGSHGARPGRRADRRGPPGDRGRPAEKGRRRGGKSDRIDAVRAARQALATPDHAAPRTGDTREALRILLATREHATKTRTATVNTLKALILTAPDELRAQFRARPTAAQVRAALALPARSGQPASHHYLHAALRQFARQITDLDATLTANLTHLRSLVRSWMPALLDQPGIGPVSAAQLLVTWFHPGRFRSEAAFAALTGTAPIPASSGRTARHRINPHGDRHANRALHTIALSRLRCHPPPSPTPPAAPPKARPPAKSAAASSATSPAAPTASWNAQHLTTHRSVFG
jgi:transposase